MEDTPPSDASLSSVVGLLFYNVGLGCLLRY